MHTIQFISTDPLDHVCRALDTIRKMGFALESVRVDGAAAGRFRVLIVVDPRGMLSVETLLARITSWVGVCTVRCESIERRNARDEEFASVG